MFDVPASGQSRALPQVDVLEKNVERVLASSPSLGLTTIQHARHRPLAAAPGAADRRRSG
jgi:hypothetical protein